jgi:4-carboxymuconolactone decarboxylase
MKPQPASPRILPLSPPYEPEIDAALRRAAPPWRADAEPLTLFRIWALHPRLGEAVAEVGRFLLGEGQLEPRDRELLLLRVCALAGAEYEWGVHACGYSPRSGLSDETIRATASSPTDDSRWSRRERLLLRLADELEGAGDVSDALFAELREIWTESEILELLLVAGFYRFVAFTVRTTRVPLERWAPRFPDDAPRNRTERSR